LDFVGGNADQWWKLSRALEGALNSASDQIDSDGKWRLKLGSAVLIGRATGDVMRMPVILQGGRRELPVGYLLVESTRIDRGRIKSLVQGFESRAKAVIDGPAAAPQVDEAVYP
jgi:hypothetical protein